LLLLGASAVAYNLGAQSERGNSIVSKKITVGTSVAARVEKHYAAHARGAANVTAPFLNSATRMAALTTKLADVCLGSGPLPRADLAMECIARELAAQAAAFSSVGIKPAEGSTTVDNLLQLYPALQAVMAVDPAQSAFLDSRAPATGPEAGQVEIGRKFAEHTAWVDRVAFVIRTGATSVLRRAPGCLLSWCTKATKVLFVSDKDEAPRYTLRGGSLLRIPATVDAAHRYGRKGDTYLESGQPWNVDFVKHIGAFVEVRNAFPDADWYVMGDDDTYFVMTGLKYVLEKHNPADDVWMG
jgi:hypothetical protein